MSCKLVILKTTFKLRSPTYLLAQRCENPQHSFSDVIIDYWEDYRLLNISLQCNLKETEIKS